MNPEHRRILEKYRNDLECRVDKNDLKQSLIKFKLFTSAMLKDIYEGDADLFEELPTRGPKAFHSFLSSLRDAGYETEAVHLESAALINYKTQLEYKDDTYDTATAGRCLIINNMKFDTLDYRTGSDKDAEGFKNFFLKVGYNVPPCEMNKTAKDMLCILEDFSKSNFKNQGSCVVIILSHGGNDKNLDVIFGSDGNYILRNEILAMFLDNEDLVGKPKVFFIQACRNMVKGGEKISNTEFYNEEKFKDILVFQSTLPYQESYRDPEKGAFFCQYLIQVLNDHHCIFDLLTMTHFVEAKMQSEFPHQATTVANYFFKKKMYIK